ncbi:diol dehydratase reactivase ATPase-like domain-containing protein, partial [Klebsiella pneumoniae]|uniref:diol dehydratase reactivase ATPase-like domain-containing protein n=1 Tax=Klebsiella pneumoniae TaxID=573 RepID=UPI0027303E32
RDIPFVGIEGGSSLDFENTKLETDAMEHYRLFYGRGNIRVCEGPRNAVASVLLLSWQKGCTHGE